MRRTPASRTRARSCQELRAEDHRWWMKSAGDTMVSGDLRRWQIHEGPGMGRARTLLLLLLFLCHTCRALDITVPPSHIEELHTDALLSCTFKVEKPPVNIQFLAVFWYFRGKEIVRYDSKTTRSTGSRFTMDEQELRRGNASLTINDVTISDEGSYKCTVVYSPKSQEKEIQLRVLAVPVVTIQKHAVPRGETSLFQCSISNFYPNDMKVTWLKNGQTLSASVISEDKMNADQTYTRLSSANVTFLEEQGNPKLTCKVEHEYLQEAVKDVYIVQFGAAPIVNIKTSRTIDGNEQIYTCEATDYSPENVTMRWLLDGKLIDYPRRSESGKFHREIYYRIQTEGVNQPSKISCQVLHETSQRPITRTEDVIVDRECKRSCHSGFIGVLVLLLVVSLPAVWYFTKRVFQRFQVSPIHMRETEDGNNVTLYCTASNCAKEPLVTWTIKEKDKEEMEITDNNQERDEETPLVGSVKSSGYTMRTERSHADKLHHVMSSLSFAPTGLKHREIAVTCKFQCDGRSQEKSRMCSFLIRKPEVSGPVLMSLGDNGDVLCSLCLQKFYPKRMKIQWSHGLGQFQEVETNHETFIRNDDMTYNVRSECRVPGHLFKDEGFRVRAAWSHEKESGQREATITDTQWLPVMGKMENPPFIDGKEAKLLCQVSGYFPNVLDVKWLRRDAGGSDPCLISASEKYIIPEMEATQQEDKTFSYTACLVVSVSAPTDHGSEFICRVRHPSLKTPQEQRSGELRVIGILAVNVVRLNTDKLRAEVIHVNPDNGEYLKITWSRCEGKKDYKKYEDTEVEEEKISSSDGSSTRYSRIYIESKKKKKYYRVMVEHSASSRVEEKNILRENDEFYLIDKEERKTLLLQVSEQVVPGKKR